MKRKFRFTMVTTFTTIILLCLINCTLIEAKVNSPAEAQQKITELKSVYNGKYWNGGLTQQQLISAADSGATSSSALGLTTSACGSSCRSNTFQGNTQCKGFARFFQYLLWGKTLPLYAEIKAGTTNGYTLYEGNSLSNLTLQPGDFVWTPGHALVIWKIENGYVYVAEAWGSSGCKISWSKGYNYSSSYDTQSEIINKVKSDDGYIARYTSYVTDTKAPTISDLGTLSVSSSSFTIACNLSDNVGVTRVWMVVYGPNGEKQFGVSASNGYFSYTVNTADYGGAGKYSVHIYAFDAAENKAKATISVSMTYTITYDANGGTGAPAPQEKLYGQDITLSATQPTRDGYIFWGWATSPDASMSTWAVGDTFSYNGDITLYAFWKSKYYTITYDANGGTGAPSSQVKTYGQDTTLSNVLPVRDGFTFWGWATSPDASMSTWAVGDTFSYNGDITLYAFWLPNYTINYDANGGIGAPEPQIKIHGQNIQLSNVQPTRAGFIFWGWATSPDASISTWAVGDDFSYDADVTLYAYWKPNLNLYADKSEISIGKPITFHYDFSYAPSVWLCIDKDGTDYADLYVDPTSYTMSFNEPGTYSVTVCVYYGADYYETNKMTFIVFGTDSIVTKTGNTHTVKTTLYNIEDSCEVIVAGYKEGKFVACKSLPYNQAELTFTLEGDLDEIKVMAWGDLSSMISLCGAEVIPSSEWVEE